MISRLTSSSIWRKTLPRRQCRSGRTVSSANSWKTSCLVSVGTVSVSSDAHEHRERRYNVAFRKVPLTPCGPSHPPIRITCATVYLDASFNFPGGAAPIPRPPNPPALRMCFGLRRSQSLRSHHPMVRRLLRLVIHPGRSRVRDVRIERPVRSGNGREPQGIVNSIPNVATTFLC